MFMLFLIPTLIWGSTWLVITLQFGVVAPEVSVLYRFIITTAVALGYCWFKKSKLTYGPNLHWWFFIHGFCNFCMNYLLTYHAETLITSGLVAVTFTFLPYFNAAGMRLIYKQKVERKFVIGLAFGGVGIFLLFQREILGVNPESSSLIGLGLGILATLFASAGNLISLQYHKRKIPISSGTAWAMFYGALSVLIICLVRGTEFNWDNRPIYWLSLLYLAIPGTVIAFLMYFTLIAKIGAARAAYTSIVIPVIALVLSTVFEGYKWSLSTWIGLGLILAGNFLVLVKTSQKSTQGT